MAGLLQRILGLGQPYVPVQRLPTDGWCRADGIGRMNLVWPWFEVLDPQPLVDGYGRDVGVVPKLELRAPRSDNDAAVIVWVDTGGGFLVRSDWAPAVARLYPGARIEVNTPLALDRAVGRLTRLNDHKNTTWRVIVPRESITVQFEASVPSGHADAYWAQLESMLATWGWAE